MDAAYLVRPLDHSRTIMTPGADEAAAARGAVSQLSASASKLEHDDNRAAFGLLVAVSGVVAAVALAEARYVALLGVFPLLALLRRRPHRRTLARRFIALAPLALFAALGRGWSLHASGSSVDAAISAGALVCLRIGVCSAVDYLARLDVYSIHDRSRHAAPRLASITGVAAVPPSHSRTYRSTA
jgi:hypothetical protein